jgi:putative FmdB family regulatory protein
MPTYQYRCTECGHDLEVVQKFTDSALTECPNCHGQLRKIFNAVGVVFKGSGFYRTDSREKVSENGSSSKSEKGSKESGGKDSGSKESVGSGSGSKESVGSGSGSKESSGSAPAKADSGSGSAGSGSSSKQPVGSGSSSTGSKTSST